jgi:hypothetical protein
MLACLRKKQRPGRLETSMASIYGAFGIALMANVELPGMRSVESTASLPSLHLRIVSESELDRAWSGRALGTWRGRLGDGERFEVERGRAGDILFRYGGRARFQLSPDGAMLRCCVADIEALDWRRVLLTRVLPNAAIAHGYEALHAAAVVDDDERVVAIAASSGAGKSTLARELARHGGRPFADDTVVLGHGKEGDVEAHPSSPYMNLDLNADDEGLEELATFAGERWVASRTWADRPGPLSSVVIFARGAGLPLGAAELEPSPVTLAPFVLGLPDEEGREEGRFQLLADLAESTRLIRLTAPSTVSPAELVATLEPHLEWNPTAAAGRRP